MPKITFENRHGIYSIEHYEEIETLDDVFEMLIQPVLIAAGFHPDNIKEEIEYAKEEMFENNLTPIPDFNDDEDVNCPDGE